MIKDDLGNRMKEYERISRIFLPRKIPVIIRIDGKAFHTLTRGMDKPFDLMFISAMEITARYLIENVQNCKLAYVQSDEISLYLDDTTNLHTEAYFNNNLQKLCSVTASMATMKFNQVLKVFKGKEGMFDARAFSLPKEDVPNYFIWRMRDWTRNSIQMLARSLYSAKELQNKKVPELMDMMMRKNTNWNDLDGYLKNGTLFYKNEGDIVTFTKSFSYLSLSKLINDFVYIGDNNED